MAVFSLDTDDLFWIYSGLILFFNSKFFTGKEGEPVWADLCKQKRNKVERSPDENQSGNVVRRKTFLEDTSTDVDMEDGGMEGEEENQGGPPLEAVSISEVCSRDDFAQKMLT